ncbi:MAG: hypothetical protein RIR39_1730 [Pseudomonadota bacterium]
MSSLDPAQSLLSPDLPNEDDFFLFTIKLY